MARKSRVAQELEAKPDLTPMIDIVFNLIMEDLQLAYADQATPDKAQGRTLVVNVKEPGVARVGGRSYALEPGTRALYPDLGELLEIEVAAADPPGATGSSPGVTIRADKEMPALGVQRVLDRCMRNRIVQTRLSATPGPLD